MPSPYWKALWDAVHVQSWEEADATLEELIRQCQAEDPRLNYAEAKAIQLSNVGWFFGELSQAEKKHALQMWPEAAHPIFGRDIDVDQKALFSAGVVLAQYWNQSDKQGALAAARKVIEESKE